MDREEKAQVNTRQTTKGVTPLPVILPLFGY